MPTRPLRAPASATASASPRSSASGFSISACLPCSNAASASRACAGAGAGDHHGVDVGAPEHLVRIGDARGPGRRGGRALARPRVRIGHRDERAPRLAREHAHVVHAPRPGADDRDADHLHRDAHADDQLVADVARVVDQPSRSCSGSPSARG